MPRKCDLGNEIINALTLAYAALREGTHEDRDFRQYALDSISDQLYIHRFLVDCDACGHRHPHDFDGDCRDDSNRF